MQRPDSHVTRQLNVECGLNVAWNSINVPHVFRYVGQLRRTQTNKIVCQHASMLKYRWAFPLGGEDTTFLLHKYIDHGYSQTYSKEHIYEETICPRKPFSMTTMHSIFAVIYHCEETMHVS